MLEGYARGRDEDDIKADVARLIEIPESMDVNHLWSRGNLWGSYNTDTEWSDDTPSACVTKHCRLELGPFDLFEFI